MRRRIALIVGVVVVFAGLGGVRMAAEAHTCEDPDDPENCHPSVVENWRGQYVPAFGLEDREDEQQREHAQRWHQECQSGGQYQQQCVWLYGGTTVAPDDDGNVAPMEQHAGLAMTHCFAGEAFHQCENHNDPGEGEHDSHGGSIYVDVCVNENPEADASTAGACDEGLQDTQAGITIEDHNPCGNVAPVVACTDEYHVVRPFDGEYTEAQTDDTAAWVESAQTSPADHFASWICGDHPSSQSCRDRVDTFFSLLPF